MREILVSEYVGLSEELVVEAVSCCCVEHDLCCRLSGNLKRYPGSLHWHFGNEKQSGTLEITYWPSHKRLWISVQEGRRSAWIDEIAPQLAQSISEALEKKRTEQDN